MKRCHHTYPVIRDIDEFGLHYGKAISRWCLLCADYVPWGPARDTPAALVELRAAEIAISGPDFTQMTFHERMGWWLSKLPMAVPESDDCWAGWLASAIAAHDARRRCGSQGLDENGHCSRCGLIPNAYSDECPPGFLEAA